MPIQPFLAPAVPILDTLEDGRGLARLPNNPDGSSGQVVFVEGGIPGDVADVWIHGKQKKVLAGRVQQLLQPSPDRVTPPCQHFSDCGGCKWQHMDYAAQLRFKQKQVVDAMERIAQVPIQHTHPIIGCEQPYWYRNKLEFTFSNRRWKARSEMKSGHPEAASAEGPVPHHPEAEIVIDGSLPPGSRDVGMTHLDNALGFHVPGAFDKVLNIEQCWLQDERINAVRNEVLTWSRAHHIPFFDLKEQTGVLRNLVFRTSRATGELLVMLILAQPDEALVDRLFTHLSAQFPFITSLLWLYNPKRNDSYSELQPSVWRGTPYIREQLFDKWFTVSPTSFFQTNTSQAERLYGVVRQYVQAALPHPRPLSQGERGASPLLLGEDLGEGSGGEGTLIYDLYCGAGSIGICLADLTQRVLGVEYVASAVADAEANVQLNQLSGFAFEAGDIAKLLGPELIARHGKPDLIVTDPPRAGMAEAVIHQLLALECPHIIYVSCNPATQARDLALLHRKYDVLDLQPVDMFPQTSHVEAVARLQLTANS